MSRVVGIGISGSSISYSTDTWRRCAQTKGKIRGCGPSHSRQRGKASGSNDSSDDSSNDKNNDKATTEATTEATTK